jgi:hypothetical protein
MRSDTQLSRQGSRQDDVDNLFSTYVSAEPNTKVTVTGPSYSVGRTSTSTFVTTTCTCSELIDSAE